MALGLRMKCQALPSSFTTVVGASPVAPWINAMRPGSARQPVLTSAVQGASTGNWRKTTQSSPARRGSKARAVALSLLAGLNNVVTVSGASDSGPNTRSSRSADAVPPPAVLVAPPVVAVLLPPVAPPAPDGPPPALGEPAEPPSGGSEGSESSDSELQERTKNSVG